MRSSRTSGCSGTSGAARCDWPGQRRASWRSGGDRTWSARPRPRRHGGTPRAALGRSRSRSRPTRPSWRRTPSPTTGSVTAGRVRAGPGCAPAQLRAEERLAAQLGVAPGVLDVRLSRRATSDRRVRPTDRRASCSSSARPASSMVTRRPTNGRILPPAAKPQQIGVDFVGDVASERVEAEAAHAGVDRVDPGHHHGHDVDVPDAGHA